MLKDNGGCYPQGLGELIGALESLKKCLRAEIAATASLSESHMLPILSPVSARVTRPAQVTTRAQSRRLTFATMASSPPEPTSTYPSSKDNLSRLIMASVTLLSVEMSRASRGVTQTDGGGTCPSTTTGTLTRPVIHLSTHAATITRTPLPTPPNAPWPHLPFFFLTTTTSRCRRMPGQGHTLIQGCIRKDWATSEKSFACALAALDGGAADVPDPEPEVASALPTLLGDRFKFLRGDDDNVDSACGTGKVDCDAPYAGTASAQQHI
ncbi:hypothetical protein JB92DRAFT_3229018 [Gautieria morchelliformis]|nr:hypothetical protein JB92DRAFT_3229018 [Gautieria morchelliformis]